MAEYSSEDYARANTLNAQLATADSDALVEEARTLAEKMRDYVRDNVEDYEAFIRRVNLSEQFSLTDAMKVGKKERALKVIYQRAASLGETAAEAKARLKSRS